VLYSTSEEAAEAPRGDIVLTYCSQCNHIFNSDYDSGKMDYGRKYENSLHYSLRFQEYASSLAKRLIETYELRSKTVLEIGCGKGDFLNMLCELGENKGIGFDPSYEAGRFSDDSQKRFLMINDFYSKKYAEYSADLIVCRHVLEHIESPWSFLNMLRQSLFSKGNTILFFEVPNVMFTLKDLSIWDLIYEHCGYFSEASLSYLFGLCGFTILNMETTFGDQFICIEASSFQDLSDLEFELMKMTVMFTSYIKNFSNEYHRKVSEWKNKVEEFENGKNKVVIWGAGSKGVTFLNVLGLQEQIEYIVDINPHKQGMYAPGTGQLVISPDKLQEIHPDIVIAMNPIYEDEIQQVLFDLGLNPKLFSV
jgi:SAM-dependent methyltransferase